MMMVLSVPQQVEGRGIEFLCELNVYRWLKDKVGRDKLRDQ